jgi:glycosyltransferase involved in cell wall biosynthesis
MAYQSGNKIHGLKTSGENIVPKVSILVPVYNGERHLARTFESILDQSFESFEVIIIDDCSTDDSEKIIRKYCFRDKRFKYICTPRNLGDAPKAINYAASSICGEWFVYSSQDDYFSIDWLQSMVDKGEAEQADAVIPDVICATATTGDTPKSFRGIDGDRKVIIDGRMAFRLSCYWKLPGNALWRRKFIDRYGYPDFCSNADEFNVRLFFLKSERVVFSEGTFYYWQDNKNAITKALTVKTLEFPYIQFRLWQLAKAEEFDHELQRYLIRSSVRQMAYMYFVSFLPRLRGGRDFIVRSWEEHKSNDVASWLKDNGRGTSHIEQLVLFSRYMMFIVGLALVSWSIIRKKLLMA